MREENTSNYGGMACTFFHSIGELDESLENVMRPEKTRGAIEGCQPSYSAIEVSARSEDM
jgi:hypothetical protein